MVPAIAVPKEEPKLETLRDSPEISPCLDSGKLDCTTFTEGVSIKPTPRPVSSNPGAKAQATCVPCTIQSPSNMPATVSAKPVIMRSRCANFLDSGPAASDDASKPTVAAVKIM